MQLSGVDQRTLNRDEVAREDPLTARGDRGPPCLAVTLDLHKLMSGQDPGGRFVVGGFPVVIRAPVVAPSQDLLLPVVELFGYHTSLICMVLQSSIKISSSGDRYRNCRESLSGRSG